MLNSTDNIICGALYIVSFQPKYGSSSKNNILIKNFKCVPRNWL